MRLAEGQQVHTFRASPTDPVDDSLSACVRATPGLVYLCCCDAHALLLHPQCDVVDEPRRAEYDCE